MKKLFFILMTITVTNSAKAQNNTYIKKGSIGEAKPVAVKKKEPNFLWGPVPHRTIEETIGETYLILPLAKTSLNNGYSFIYKGLKAESEFHLSATEGEGKLLNLVGVNDKITHFKDSTGADYTSEINDNGYMFDLVPVFDIDESRRLFLGKTLWLARDYIQTYDAVKDERNKIEKLRFEPLKIIDIVASDIAPVPVRFIVKTGTGEVGFVGAVVSGTNSSIQFCYKNGFENIFYTTDPKLLYKYTPKMWARIKSGLEEIGMTKEQVRLTLGAPKSINNSAQRSPSFDQWVYGSKNLYFTNDKLTSVQY